MRSKQEYQRKVELGQRKRKKIKEETVSFLLDFSCFDCFSLDFLEPAKHGSQILTDFFDRVLGFAAAHGGEASFTRLVF
jgi:hypothetical protein